MLCLGLSQDSSGVCLVSVWWSRTCAKKLWALQLVLSSAKCGPIAPQTEFDEGGVTSG